MWAKVERYFWIREIKNDWNFKDFPTKVNKVLQNIFKIFTGITKIWQSNSIGFLLKFLKSSTVTSNIFHRNLTKFRLKFYRYSTEVSQIFHRDFQKLHWNSKNFSTECWINIQLYSYENFSWNFLVVSAEFPAGITEERFHGIFSHGITKKMSLPNFEPSVLSNQTIQIKTKW